jgi:hypothetical protein
LHTSPQAQQPEKDSIHEGKVIASATERLAA